MTQAPEVSVVLGSSACGALVSLATHESSPFNGLIAVFGFLAILVLLEV